MPEEPRELKFKEDGQQYAKVLRMLGAGRLEAHCFDGRTRQCVIRGSMRRRVWVAVGDIILVTLRDYQPSTADVVYKYTIDEARSLVRYGALPASALAESADEPDDIQFSDGEVDLDAI